MKLSIVICSYNRPSVLPKCLATVAAEVDLHPETDVVLVHRSSDIATAEVMTDFRRSTKVQVDVRAAERPGLSVARNIGLAAAKGDLLIFTDDDCLMNPGYLSAVLAGMEDAPQCSYGGGGVFDAELFIPGTTHLRQKSVVGPNTIVGAGVFSGCNMFFRKEVFERIGNFREDMGAGSGMSFVGAEDLEMTTRASFSGLTGILLPNAVITHDHQRKPNSKEMQDLDYSYNVSRGSFYGYMLMHGIGEIWQHWAATSSPNKNRRMAREQIVQLQQELYGASEYLDYCLKNDVDVWVPEAPSSKN